MKDKYMSTFTKADLIATASPVVITGQFVKLGEFVVPAGMEVSCGFGAYDDLERAVGRLFIKLIDDTAGNATVEAGKVRLSVWSPQNRPLEIIYEGRTEVTGSGSARNLYVPFPEHAINIKEDQKLVFEFMSDADDILGKAYCELYVDVTCYVI